MKYNVYIKENKTNNLVKTVLETESHDDAYQAVNEYNKEYGTFLKLLQEYPKKKYSIDVNKDEVN